jgi:phosphatidate cytidylyltransferase
MLLKRILTGAALIAVALAALLWAPVWLFFLLLVPFGLLALWEYLELVARTGSAPPRWPVYAVALGVWAVAAWFPQHLMPAVIGGVLLLLLSALGRRQATAEILPASAASAFALLYIGVPFAFLLDLFAWHGYRIVLCLFLLVWAGDTAAYFVGRALGRHKLAPVLSPGKTVEGTAASLAATVALGYWLLPAWFGVGAAHAFLLPVIVNVAAQLGDLAESALKRSAGVKDSSTLLPGHGGVLDRVDSLLFAAPALWYYWNLLVRGSF